MLTVSLLSTTPMRSTALHHPDAVELGMHGVEDDRRYSIHTPDGALFDAVRHGALVQVRSELDRSGGTEVLTVRLPDGEVVRGPVEPALGPPVPLEFHGRRFTARRLSGTWADALSAWVGRPLAIYRSERLPEERDRNGVSIMTEASVDELARRGNDGHALDPRRFRMLIQVAGAERPHLEDDWVGRQVRIGEALVRITKPVSRCVITTQDPDTGARDFPTLRIIRSYRGARDGGKLDFGVYAEVVRPGRIALGDAIRT